MLPRVFWIKSFEPSRATVSKLWYCRYSSIALCLVFENPCSYVHEQQHPIGVFKMTKKLTMDSSGRNCPELDGNREREGSAMCGTRHGPLCRCMWCKTTAARSLHLPPRAHSPAPDTLYVHACVALTTPTPCTMDNTHLQSVFGSKFSRSQIPINGTRIPIRSHVRISDVPSISQQCTNSVAPFKLNLTISLC